MRRFTAFIVLSISVLLGVAFNFGNVLKNTTSGLDYASGREFVFRVTDLEDEEAILRQSDINEVRDIIERRLTDADVKRYKVTTEGNDQIRVQVGETTTTRYTYIRDLVTFNATFELATTDDLSFAEEDEIFRNSVARIAFKNSETDNVLPYIVIPISDKEMIQTLAEDALAITPESTDEEATSTPDENMLILWAGKGENDSYEKANNTEDPDYERMQEKIFMKFDPNNLYFDATTQNEIAVQVNANDSNGNEVIDNNEVRAAVELATHFTHLFNAGSLEYNVEYLFDIPTEAIVEDFVNYGTIATLANSDTTIAFVVGLLLITVFLGVFYRLGGMSSIITAITTLFFTFMVFNAIGLEFNIAAVVGLIMVTLVSVVASIIYQEKLKEESHKGRSLKKANSEAIKKTGLVIADIHIVLLIISGITYFLGRGMLESLAMMGVIGSVISYILNITIYRLFMWLIANTTSFQNKPEVLGIKKENIPNLLKDEKQTYYGPFADKEYTKNAKKKNIIIASVSGVIAATMLIIGLVTGSALSRSVPSDVTRVYYDIHERSSSVDDEFSVSYLTTQFTKAGIEVSNVEVYESVDENDEPVFYYVIDLEENLQSDDLVLDGSMTLEDYVATLISNDDDSTDVVSIRNVVGTYENQPDASNVILCLSIGVLVATVYIAIRYNIANAITTLGVTGVSTIVGIGFLSIGRVSTVAPTMVSIFLMAFVAMLFSIVLAQKNKELQKDNKDDLPISEVNNRALGIASAPILIIALIAGYTAVDYVGFGPAIYASLFASALIGIGMATILILYSYMPLYNILSKVFKPIQLRRKNKKDKIDKLGNLKDKKPGEPEEKIYIGIND